MKSWDEYFVEEARLVATRSKDRTTKVGAVLVRDRRIIAKGYNGMPRGINDNDPFRHKRPAKYSYFEHAERNAIYNCAYEGIETKGCTLYVTPMHPCVDCARGIIQAGIVEVVVDVNMAVPKHWVDSINLANDMLHEAGIIVLELEAGGWRSTEAYPDSADDNV